jgi:hypothetical protein
MFARSNTDWLQSIISMTIPAYEKHFHVRLDFGRIDGVGILNVCEAFLGSTLVVELQIFARWLHVRSSIDSPNPVESFWISVQDLGEDFSGL